MGAQHRSPAEFVLVPVAELERVRSIANPVIGGRRGLLDEVEGIRGLRAQDGGEEDRRGESHERDTQRPAERFNRRAGPTPDAGRA